MSTSQEKLNNLSEKFTHLMSEFNIAGKKEEISDLQKRINQANFWEKEEKPVEIQQKYTKLKQQVDKLEDLQERLKDLKELLSIMGEEGEEEQEFNEKIEELEKEINHQERKMFLSGKYDRRGAFVFIESGAGGRDGEDWATLLLEMYKNFFEKEGWKYKIISQSFSEGGGPEGRIGTKEVSLEVKGDYAYGFLKKESGTHRLVRISPFSPKEIRHTSFARVEVMPDIKIEESEVNIDDKDLRVDTFRASGPGGQYVNRRESAIRITHKPSGIVVSCQSERSQGDNRKVAMQVLASRLQKKKMQEKQKELEKIRGEKVSPDFGNQIRSYVFHPYRLVKDHRSGVETNNVEDVLNGNLTQFIEAEIKEL